MLDYVVSGARGFIGSHLVERLHAAGYAVVSDREFQGSAERTRIFVNCTNVAASPSAAVRLLLEKSALARGRADIFVHLLSFSTLLGKGVPRLHEVNCGFVPDAANLYSAGKLEEERALCRLAGEPGAPRLCLAYLPAVLGAGGSWSAVLEQSQRHGFSLPPGMGESARANWIEIDDLVELLTALQAQPPDAALTRIVLNRPEAERTTWSGFLGGRDRERPEARGGAKARAREFAIEILMRMFAIASRYRALLPVEGAIRMMRPPAAYRVQSGSRPIPDETFAFRSLMRRIAATQPYLPGGASPARNHAKVAAPHEGAVEKTQIGVLG